MAAAAELCPICCDAEPPADGACPACAFAACRQCVRSALLVQTSALRAKCMSCSAAWSRAELVAAAGETFVNGKAWRGHRLAAIMTRERALLPRTQAAVAEHRRLQGLYNETQAAYSAMIDVQDKIETSLARRAAPLFERVKELASDVQLGEEVKRVGMLYLYRVAHDKRMRDRSAALFALHEKMARLLTDEASALGGVARPRPCPSASCHGTVCAPDWTCVACRRKACASCTAAAHDGAPCAADAVATAAMLVSDDVRPCPGCGTGVSKVEGCRHMWCTGCHTTFDWVTGAQIRAPVGNPHLLDWMVERRPAIDSHEFARKLHKLTLAALELRAPSQHDNADLRRKWVSGDLDEAKFAALVLRRDTVNARGIEEGNLLMWAVDEARKAPTLEDAAALLPRVHARIDALAKSYGGKCTRRLWDWRLQSVRIDGGTEGGGPAAKRQRVR